MTTPRAVVLVEGASDRAALEAVARLRGGDLATDGVAIVPMGGITNTRAFASQYGPLGLDLPMAGLYDAPDEAKLRRGLAAAGLDTSGHALPSLGFYQCSADLEDELIRALGIEGVEAVIAAAGEAASLRLLARMPAQRGWPRMAVIRRFLTSRSGRKQRYATLMVEALGPQRVPAPLTEVLGRV